VSLEGSRILHYEIVRMLGRGGMGQVYEARDARLGRRVALKFIAPGMAADAESAKRFEREAMAAAALSHPHIATLYALEHDGPTLFIAMELMDGGSLRERMNACPRMPVAEALGVARDVAAALAHAHRRGITHRDIKPENLMFDEEGAVKVMDFGLARAAQASRLTMTGSTLGTPAYMAPESTRGATGAPADVFALGVLLYEALAGALPFPGENPMALLYMIANEAPRPLGEHRPDLPGDVVALLDRMLVKDPAERADAATMARELAVRTGAPLPPAEPEPAPAGTPAPAALAPRAMTEEVEVERVGEPGTALAPARRALVPSRHRARAMSRVIGIVALVALAVVLVVAGWRYWRQAHPNLEELRLQARTISDQAVRLIEQGATGPALRLLEKALRLDPRAVAVRINYGVALREQGRATEATHELVAVTRDTAAAAAQRAQAWVALAEIAIDDGTWPQAAERLREAFALDSSERTFSQYGYALVHSAHPGEALTLLERGLVAYPGSAAIHKNAAYALLALGRLPDALTEIDRALAADPGFAPALGIRARIRARQGNRAGARTDWDAWLPSRPTRADSLEAAADLRAAGVLD
jgi:tetratricopeptide (TPR) repeat protein